MHMGASAEQAVEAACIFDAWTSGPVNFFVLDALPEPEIAVFTDPPTDRQVQEAWRQKMGL
jgi:hypothetical protein